MKLFIVTVVSVTLFGMIVAVADEKSETAPPKVGDTAPEWTLQDAEEKEHNLKKLRGKVVFLIMGNRKIREEDDKWAEAFQKDYKENEKVVAYIIGDLRSVPGIHTETVYQEPTEEKPTPCGILAGLERGSAQTVSDRKKEADALPHLARRHYCVPPEIELHTRDLR